MYLLTDGKAVPYTDALLQIRRPSLNAFVGRVLHSSASAPTTTDSGALLWRAPVGRKRFEQL